MIADCPVRRLGIMAPLEVHRIAPGPPVDEGDRNEHQTVDDGQKNPGVDPSHYGGKTEPRPRQHARRPPEEEADEKEGKSGVREGPRPEDQSSNGAGGGENGKGLEGSVALGIIVLTRHGARLRGAQKMV
jgi:hypothetical protein